MVYVGMTNNPERRWKEHINNNTGSRIHTAIKRYGVSNFDFVVLERGIPSYALAAERERYYIKSLNAHTRLGYNDSDGGESPNTNYFAQNRKENLKRKHKLKRRK